jgi:hypothetical protein
MRPASPGSLSFSQTTGSTSSCGVWAAARSARALLHGYGYRVATQQATTVKPSKAWIWLGALVLLAGLISAATVAIGSTMALSKTVDGFARIRVPDDVNCRLIFTKPGTYTVYYEYQGDVARRNDTCEASGGVVPISASKTAPVGLDVTLIDDRGKEIASTRNTNDVSVSLNGHAGVAVRQVVIPAAGDYSVKVDKDTLDRAGSNKFVLAFGRGATTKIVPYFGLAALLGLLGLGIGLPMMLVTRAKRKKARTVLATATTAPNAWGAGGQTPTWTPTVPPPPTLQPEAWAPTTSVPSPSPPSPSPLRPPAGGSPWAPPPPPN